MPGLMKAAVIVEPDCNVLEDEPIPGVGPLDSLIQMAGLHISSGEVALSMVDGAKGRFPGRSEPISIWQRSIPLSRRLAAL